MPESKCFYLIRNYVHEDFWKVRSSCASSSDHSRCSTLPVTWQSTWLAPSCQNTPSILAVEPLSADPLCSSFTADHFVRGDWLLGSHNGAAFKAASTRSCEPAPSFWALNHCRRTEIALGFIILWIWSPFLAILVWTLRAYQYVCCISSLSTLFLLTSYVIGIHLRWKRSCLRWQYSPRYLFSPTHCTCARRASSCPSTGTWTHCKTLTASCFLMLSAFEVLKRRAFAGCDASSTVGDESGYIYVAVQELDGQTDHIHDDWNGLPPVFALYLYAHSSSGKQR